MSWTGQSVMWRGLRTNTPCKVYIVILSLLFPSHCFRLRFIHSQICANNKAHIGGYLRNPKLRMQLEIRWRTRVICW